jgi:dTDP-4-dehydrorhamnose reductase
MKVLLLGGRGQVGWELHRALAPLGEVIALDREPRDALCGDLERPDELRRTVRRLGPQIIVNAAAYTDVHGAESAPEQAERVNAEAPGILAAEAAHLDAWLVHYSTDYVFDGSGTTPWREDDAAAPLNVYGRTKWQGEQAVRESGCRHSILRTQWVYSSRRSNFLRTVLRLAAERDVLEVVDDQVGAPTGAELIADATAHVVRSLTARQGSRTYHVAARGETTWHGYACFVIESARRAGWPLRLTESAVAPVTSDTLAAPRPRNSRLDVDRLERTFELRMPDWRVGVARAVAEISELRRANDAS